jgi:hypothetical protein
MTDARRADIRTKSMRDRVQKYMHVARWQQAAIRERISIIKEEI